MDESLNTPEYREYFKLFKLHSRDDRTIHSQQTTEEVELGWDGRI